MSVGLWGLPGIAFSPLPLGALLWNSLSPTLPFVDQEQPDVSTTYFVSCRIGVILFDWLDH